MAREVILAEQTIEFAYNSTFGAYEGYARTAFTLSAGETYIIAWDGTEYICVAYETNILGASDIVVGTQGSEPFMAFSGPNGFILSDTTAESHTVAIYLEVAEPELIIKTPLGVDAAYPVKDNIKLYNSDGDLVNYAKGEAVENVPVTLDFSGGDQTVTADAGTLMKSVAITKPETLVPENIPQGITIAGIEGTRKDTGGDFDSTDEYLKYFTPVIDVENKRVILLNINYTAIDEGTGSTDVVIPDKIGGYDVWILATGSI